MSERAANPVPIKKIFDDIASVFNGIKSVPTPALSVLVNVIQTEIRNREIVSAPPMLDEELGLGSKLESVKAYRDRTGLSLRVCIETYEKRKRGE